MNRRASGKLKGNGGPYGHWPATTLGETRSDHRVQMEPMTDTGNVVVSVLAMNSNERLHLATGFNDRDQ